MEQNKSPEQFLIKKSYEICYALVRISSSVKRESFARRLEENGFLLLEAAVSGEPEKISRASTAVEYLLRLGSDVGFVHPANAETISRELQYLNSAIAEYGNAARATEVNLNGIFTSQQQNNTNLAKTDAADDLQHEFVDKNELTNSMLVPATDSYAPKNLHISAMNQFLENGGNIRNIAKAAIRQSMILERIRQNNGCRMKEIQEILPDVSERTLRYDLQDLMERGAIERIGNGGPATSYRAK